MTGFLALLGPLLQIVAPYGVAAVQAVVKIFTSPTAPTQADWDALLAATSKTARQEMMEALAAHGIDPNSPQGQAFIALTPP